MADDKRLAIKLNNAITNDPCAICGARTDPTGIDLFLADTWELVCIECGRKHAPELAALLDLASAADSFAAMAK
jgi:hypothetical protein